jgi:hypothetical protein
MSRFLGIVIEPSPSAPSSDRQTRPRSLRAAERDDPILTESSASPALAMTTFLRQSQPRF